ncbi:MAG: isoaspartyl peptidase/L-asparaginase [Bacteroidetes bacterium]|nr:isoaspartyl peptidase/L-asparaginase [Bacteroidota bacterium]
MRLLFAALALLMVSPVASTAQPAPERPIALALHGGAGTILRQNLTPEREAAVRAALEQALDAGYAVLQRGGTALDAVEATIRVLEESPHFNAGVGAVLTDAGTAELDAAVMDGRTRAAGAVSGITTVRSPIQLARRVMERSPHVMLVGAGAEEFAGQQGLERVTNDFFILPERREQLRRMQENRRTGFNALGVPDPSFVSPERFDAALAASPDLAGGMEHKFGTVGAVALDRDGNLAAGTSTGGMMGKKFGRVGDAPIIGAGTYADNATCAVSATGHGEYFIRAVVAHDIASIIRYTGLSLTQAASAVVHGSLVEMGGGGGVIAVDPQGRVTMPFNTPGMYRAAIDGAGNRTVAIFRD